MSALKKLIPWLTTTRGVLLVIALVICVAVLRGYEVEATSGGAKLHLTPR